MTPWWPSKDKVPPSTSMDIPPQSTQEIPLPLPLSCGIPPRSGGTFLRPFYIKIYVGQAHADTRRPAVEGSVGVVCA